MKYLAFTTVIFLIWIYSIPNYAQSVGIGTTDPNANAALHIVSPNNNQGILIPSLTTDQRTNSEFISNLPTADNGLLVFDITTNNFYFWLGDDWEPVVSGTVGQNLSAGIGMQITNNQIINTGDTDSTDDITINTPAEGALTGFYPAPELAEGSVGTTNLEDSAVTGNKISDNTIGVQKLVGLSDPTSGRNSLLITNNSNLPRWFQPSLNQVIVTDNAGQISSRPIGSFTQTLLPEGNIFIGDINGDANVLDASNNGRILIGNGTTVVSVPMMGDLSVDASGTATIQPNAITSAEIADNSITSGDLADLTITSAKIAANAIESSNIADGTILTTKIANDAVQSAQILDGTIANADLAAGAVNSTSIEDETIVNADVAATAGIEVQKLETMATGTIMFGNSGVPTIGVLQGDASIDASGNLSIGTLSSVDINGGTIDNTVIGGDTPADGTFTNLSASNGSGIEGLDADNLTEGTIADDRFPAIGANGTFGGGGVFIEQMVVDPQGRVTSVTANPPPSDLRLKEDFKQLNYSPQLLNKLQAYRYYWKDGKFGEDVQIGLIAQDVERVYPELVKLRSDGYKGVLYNGFIPILVEATKTQQATIDALETENQGLINTIEIINHKLDEQNEKILMLEELVRKILKENSSTSEPVTQAEIEKMGNTDR